MSEFLARGCDILGISTDTLETHQRWLTTLPADGGLGPIQFPLASDPDGAASQQYGVYVEDRHVAHRGLFIIGPDSVLQYQVVHSLSVGRSSDEVLRVLDALQIGGLCPGEREAGQPPIDVLEVLAPNRVIGPYEVKVELGTGAFGKVFGARDMLLDRDVALKVLRSNDQVPTESLLSEARAAAALNHPNVCTVHAVDTSLGAAMIVMEYVDGQPLSDRLKAGPLTTEESGGLGRQVARGMAAAHAAGVVHGDLKPSNLMVTPAGKIKIMDFGLARRVLPAPQRGSASSLIQPLGTSLSGTPGYMAPELTRGEPPTPASDVFALGLILYEMLAGQPAVTGKNIVELLLRMEQFDAADIVSNVPEQFAAILRRCLEAQAVDRKITMAEIAQELGSMR